MTQVLAKPGRSLLALLAVLAIAVAACGGSSATSVPASASPAASPSEQASVEPSSSDDGSDISNAGEAFANINNYKFSITMLAPEFTGALTQLTGGSADQAITISGTVIIKPEAAADITMAGIHIIEVGGKQYMDIGTGFISTPASGSSMADAFSPSTLFEDFVGGTHRGFVKVGTGEKNGVSAIHYQATKAGLEEIAASASDVEGATWTSDVWLASDGGFPVSVSAIATKDGTIVWEMVMDVMNINDPSNKVVAPF
jgi:hypothetical protein